MSLVTIEAALLARLGTLLTTASPAGRFEQAVRVAGDRETQAKLEQQAMTAATSVHLALDRVSPTEQTHTTLGVAAQTIMGARWRVRVMVRDLRDQATALTSATAGVYVLLDDVLTALTGFVCSGLWMGERVRFVTVEPLTHKPGRYLATAVFETRYAIHAPEITVTTEEPLIIDADINLESGSDTEPNPLVEFITT